MPPTKKRGMPKSSKKRTGIGVDFQKIKHKVGRKLLPAANTTKVEVKSKAIILPGQSVAQDKDGLAISSRRQTLKELLMQTTHHNDNVRRDAILGVKDLLARHPNELNLHAVALVEKLCQRITDKDQNVRQALLVLFRTSIFAILPEVSMRPLAPIIMAHIFSAMTHLAVTIRMSAFGFLDAFIQSYPSIVVSGYVDQINQYYIDFLGKLGVNGHTERQLPEVLDSLLHFLSAIRLRLGLQNPVANRGQQEQQDNSLKLKGEKQMVLALHWYKSAISKQVAASKFQGSSELEKNVKSPGSKTQALIEALLTCWAECAPLVCSGQTPDQGKMECMVKICQALQIIIICSKPKHGLNSLDGQSQLEVITPTRSCSSDFQKWIANTTDLLSSQLMASFPIRAPLINLPRKIDQLLITLNMAITKVILVSIITGEVQMHDQKWSLNVLLDFVEDTLGSRIHSCLGLASDVIDKKAMEMYIQSLVTCLPDLLHTISKERQTRLLQAFTKVFGGCKPTSKLKNICLTCIAEILQPKQGNVRNSLFEADNFEFQKQWLQALPKLLWELKHHHPSSSLVVLQVLHHLGRSAPQNSLLADEYNALQPMLIPFFSTQSPTKHHQGLYVAQRLQGPFVKLPVECQQVAIDLLYYFTCFSSAFIRAITHCLCPEVQTSLIVRCVEVIQAVFHKGYIGLSDHLSFLLTILIGPAWSGATDELDEKRTTFQRYRVISGAVCSCLCQLGDGKLLLHLLMPSICHQMGLPLPCIVSYGLLKMITVLSGPHRAFSVPKSLLEILPAFIANYLVTITIEWRFQKRNLKEEPLTKSLTQPCLLLLSNNEKLTELVAHHLFNSLDKESGLRLHAIVISLLRVLSMEHVRKKVSHNPEEISLLSRFEGNESINIEHIGNKELLAFLQKLHHACASAYEWPDRT